MSGKKYNWAILGPGKIAHKFASDLKLLPNAVLYAVGSRNIDRAKEFANQYGFKKAYGSYKELAEDPEVDVVYIASPHVGHYQDSLLCLRNKKAVLCEKPIAINARQCQVMIDTARENNVFFMEALWTRFLPSFLKAKELIDEGEIGEVSVIESDFCLQAPYDVEGRLFNQMLGGGALLDIGIYPVFASLEFFSKPVSIHAMSTKSNTGVDSSCSMIFKHKDDKMSVLFCSIITTGRTETLIHGSEGLIRINKEWHIPTTVDLISRNQESKHYKFIEPGYGYEYEAAEVMKCLDQNKIESDIFNWQKSTDLITTLDWVRKEAFITYPEELERL